MFRGGASENLCVGPDLAAERRTGSLFVRLALAVERRTSPLPLPTTHSGYTRGRSGGGAGGDDTGSGGAKRRWMSSEGGAAPEAKPQV